MAVQILIVEPNAASRILLRAALQSSHYDTTQAGSFAEAREMLRDRRPELILLGLSGDTPSALTFCAALRADARLARVPLIAVAGAAPAMLRLAALRAGADDVLDRQSGQAYLLARIRSLLRSRAATADLNLREDTHRALGLAEDAAPFLRPGHVAIITADLAAGPAVLAGLVRGLAGPTRLIGPGQDLGHATLDPAPDLFIIDGSGGTAQGDPAGLGTGPADLFRLIADLRSWPGTRNAATLVMLPPDMPEIAALILDLGASDITCASVGAAELAHRVQALLRQKSESDRLRDRLSHGLEAAVTDPLTGLHNRRYALPALDRITAEAAAADRGLAVMMLDIDHFKAVNDAHGHACGDRVLVEVAARLRATLAPGDLIARVGGEEFLVALTGTTPAKAAIVAERLCRVIANSPFDLSPSAGRATTRPMAAPADPGLRLRVTLSVGLACRDSAATPQAEPASQLLARADSALYAAKSEGRNRVGMASGLAKQTAA